MIVYVENLNELKKIILELLSNYRKIREYKVNIQKLIAFLHTSNDQVELKTK